MPEQSTRTTAQADGAPDEPRQQRGARNPRYRFAFSLTACFFACCLFNTLHHPMWRDEVRVWQICAASPTIAALHANLRYEGTPLLWYLIVWTITRFTSNVMAMQVVHCVIASSVVFTFALGAPFNRVAKILFAFGYFPFFEYGTISRSYSLVFLLLLLGVAILSRPRPAPFLLGIAMVFLTQVSVWGVGLAGLMMIVGFFQWRTFAPPGSEAPLWRLITASLVVLAAGVCCYFLLLPGPADSLLTQLGDIPVTEKLTGTIGTIWDGWLPIPRWQPNFWNSNVLDPQPQLRCLLSLALLAIAVLCLLRTPVALALLLGGLGGLMAFTYSQFFGYTRHHGHLFMVLIVAFWVSFQTRQCTPRPKWLADLTARFSRQRANCLIALLAVHAISGIGTNIAERFIPFSAGKEAAQYIRREFPPDMVLIGSQDYCISPIAAYLGRDLFSAEMNAFVPFATQNVDVRIRATHDSLLDDFQALYQLRNQDLLLAISGPRGLGEDEFETTASARGSAPAMTFHVKLLRNFALSNEPKESVRLYVVHRVKSG